MAKTDKEVRLELAEKNNDALKSVDEIFASLAELWYSEKEIESTRQMLISDLQGKPKEVSDDVKKHKVKTNKEIRSELAEKYGDKLNKLHKTLDSLAERWYPKEALKIIREKLLSNLQGKLEKEDWYREVKKRREYVDTHVILNDFIKDCVIIEENAKMMWYKWKKVHINLPPYKNSWWLNFDYFVSDDSVSKRDFDKKKIFAKSSKLENKSFSEEDVSKISQAIEKYIIKHKGRKMEVLRALAPIIWLNHSYWLKDLKTPSWEIYSCIKREGLNPLDINDPFIRGGLDILPAKLLLRLSD